MDNKLLPSMKLHNDDMIKQRCKSLDRSFHLQCIKRYIVANTITSHLLERERSNMYKETVFTEYIK